MVLMHARGDTSCNKGDDIEEVGVPLSWALDGHWPTCGLQPSQWWVAQVTKAFMIQTIGSQANDIRGLDPKLIRLGDLIEGSQMYKSLQCVQPPHQHFHKDVKSTIRLQMPEPMEFQHCVGEQSHRLIQSPSQASGLAACITKLMTFKQWWSQRKTPTLLYCYMSWCVTHGRGNIASWH